MSIASNTPVQFIPGIGRRTAAVLHDLDIHTFGQLARVPKQVLIELFGPSIVSITDFRVAKQQIEKQTSLKQHAQGMPKGDLWSRISLASSLAFSVLK